MSDLSIDVRRVAGWLPAQHELERWLAAHREKVARRGEDRPSPVMASIRASIENDPTLRMYVERMVAETPDGRQYGARPFDSADEFLQMVDEVLTMAPEFGDGMAATPLAAVLDWTMGTQAGLAAYRDPRMNRLIREMLDVWSAFLSSRDSLYVLNRSEHGWTSDAAAVAVGIDRFQHDADDEHWGFTSWNDFFTRRFVDGVRPVAAPGDDRVVVAPCEATPYRIRTGVQRRDRFWVKGQSYSLADLLAGDASVDGFVGGTVYQAYLSALDYHRWHSPVGGTILRAFTVPGTYYSEADSTGDPTEPADSQGYLAHMAARAVVVIDADDPTLGVLAFVAIGMVDVSSCLIADGVTAGSRVRKGDELGRFQFGGSTYCLLFRSGAIGAVDLAALPGTRVGGGRPVPVNSRLALAVPS